MGEAKGGASVCKPNSRTTVDRVGRPGWALVLEGRTGDVARDAVTVMFSDVEHCGSWAAQLQGLACEDCHAGVITIMFQTALTYLTYKCIRQVQPGARCTLVK